MNNWAQRHIPYLHWTTLNIRKTYFLNFNFFVFFFSFFSSTSWLPKASTKKLCLTMFVYFYHENGYAFMLALKNHMQFVIRQTRKNGVISNYKCVRDEQFIASYIPMQHVESSFHAMWNIKNEKTRFMLEFPRYIPEINFP